MDKQTREILSNRIIGAAIEVHKELGPGLLESVYECCLMEELKKQGVRAQNQIDLPVMLVTYLKLADKRLGLLMNFNVALLKRGIRRKINGYD